ncbi:hypothetical protein GCM10022627_37090 [Haloarcula argentinensis]
MNLLQGLYPYVLAAMNLGIGWLSVAILEFQFGVLFVGIGVLVFGAVVGRTVERFACRPSLRRLVSACPKFWA